MAGEMTKATKQQLEAVAKLRDAKLSIEEAQRFIRNAMNEGAELDEVGMRLGMVVSDLEQAIVDVEPEATA